MTPGVAGLFVAITLAFTGYLATYAINLRIARRRERLDLVTRQIAELYGPLYILTTTTGRAYSDLVRKLGRTDTDPDLRLPLKSSDFREWRLWMTHVLMPLNERCEEILLKNAFLFREEGVPDCILRFITHVEAFKPVIQKWKESDFSEEESVADFPVDLLDWAQKGYEELKREQLLLIGYTAPRP